MIEFGHQAFVGKARTIFHQMDDGLQKKLKSLPILAANDYVRFLQDEVRGSFKNRTGNLENSWSVNVVKSSPTFKGTAVDVTSSAPYASIHNKGGIIRPRVAKALTIPLTTEAKMRGAREWPNLFVWVSRAGNAFLVEGKKRGNYRMPGMRLQYLLVKQVVIKPTNYIDRARKRFGAYALTEFAGQVRRGIRGIVVGKGAI